MTNRKNFRKLKPVHLFINFFIITAMKGLRITSNVPEKELPRWDLSVAFYADLKDPQIDVDKKSLQKLSKELSLYRDTFEDMESYELSIFLRKYETMVCLSRKLSYFAFLYSDTHKDEEKAAVFRSQIRELLSQVFENLGFIHFELNYLSDYKKIEFLNNPRLQRWLPWLKSIFMSYWNLSEAANFIIDKKSIISSAWDRLYDETCTNLKFHLGKEELNEAEIAKKMGSRDANVRHKALAEMNRVYKDNARVLTMCYNMILKDKRVDDELYGMEEPVTQSLCHNNISKEDLLSMVNEITDSYIPISQRFYKLMAQMMKVDHIRYEDRNYNPVEIKHKKITWNQCMQKVLEGYAKFSLDYMSYAMQIINCGTTDVPPQKGKASGAYCTRGEVPYILLNFTGSQSDISTFAHELGHAVHHVLSAEVGILNDTTPTSLAEVASEFAENLIFSQRLSAVKTDKEKLALLIDRVQDMINSIHRQISFYKFEERTHHERIKGELSVKRLNQIWREESSRCLGFDIGDDAEYMWMGISHIFEQPYYVYSYAFAGLVVNNLFKAYQEWDEKGEFEMQEDFSDLYIDMLSNTGVEDYKSLLEPFGIDADAPDFWSKGLQVITDYINEIEKLAKSEGLL